MSDVTSSNLASASKIIIIDCETSDTPALYGDDTGSDQGQRGR